MSKKDFSLVGVSIIATFEEEEQLFGYLNVIVDWDKEPLNRELFVLDQVVNSLNAEGKTLRDLDYLVKISLSYDIKEDADLDSRWSFIMRSMSKYYFQPDQSDLIEDVIKKCNGVAGKTKPVVIP